MALDTRFHGYDDSGGAAKNAEPNNGKWFCPTRITLIVVRQSHLTSQSNETYGKVSPEKSGVQYNCQERRQPSAGSS